MGYKTFGMTKVISFFFVFCLNLAECRAMCVWLYVCECVNVCVCICGELQLPVYVCVWLCMRDFSCHVINLHDS